ncbi:MAG: response regulator transcription factor [Phycisphaerales bacterium]
MIGRRFANGRVLGWSTSTPWAGRLSDAAFPGWQSSDGGHHWSSIGSQEVLAGIVPVDLEAPDDRLIVIEAGRPAGNSFTPEDIALLRGLLAALSRRVYKAFGPEPISAARMLTPREQEVLEHLTLGWSVKEIAEKLSRSPHTVHDYVKSLHRKLQASSRGGLIARALGHHGIEPGTRRDSIRHSGARNGHMVAN